MGVELCAGEEGWEVGSSFELRASWFERLRLSVEDFSLTIKRIGKSARGMNSAAKPLGSFNRGARFGANDRFG